MSDGDSDWAAAARCRTGRSMTPVSAASRSSRGGCDMCLVTPNEAVQKREFRRMRIRVKCGASGLFALRKSPRHLHAQQGYEGPGTARTCSLSPSSATSALRPGDLLDVVYETEQVPLRVDLREATQREPIHALVVADVGGHRLNRADALAVQLSALGRIDGPLHQLGGFMWTGLPPGEERHLPDPRSLGMPPASSPQVAPPPIRHA